MVWIFLCLDKLLQCLKVLKQYGQVSGKCDGDIQGAGIVDGGIGGVIDGGIGGVVDSGIGGIVDGGVIFCEKNH